MGGNGNSCVGQLGTCDSARWLIDDILQPLKQAESVLAIIGIIVGGKLAWSAAKLAWRAGKLFIFRQWFGSVEPFNRKYGKWALITGACEGLGGEFANQLAIRGMNIILIGNDSLHLDDLRTFLVRNYGIKVCCLLLDNTIDYAVYQALSNEVLQKEVGVLGKPMQFITQLDKSEVTTNRVPIDVLPKGIGKKLQAGVGATAMMSGVVIPHMVKRKRGAVITILPSMSPGSAEPAYFLAQKGFVDQYCKGMERDFGSSGIDFLTLKPYPVRYTPEKSRIRNILYPSANRYTRSSILLLGHTSSSTGYWSFGLQSWLTSVIPISLWTYTRETLAILGRGRRGM